MRDDEIVVPIAEFVQKLYPEDETGVGMDDGLLETGIIDSLGILELISFLESHFAIRVDDADVDLENFRSLRSIAAYVNRKARYS